MNRSRIVTRAILVLLLVGSGLGLSACAEPVGYAGYGPDVYGPDVYVDGGFGGFGHRDFDHHHFDHGGGGPRLSPGRPRLRRAWRLPRAGRLAPAAAWVG